MKKFLKWKTLKALRILDKLEKIEFVSKILSTMKTWKQLHWQILPNIPERGISTNSMTTEYRILNGKKCLPTHFFFFVATINLMSISEKDVERKESNRSYTS